MKTFTTNTKMKYYLDTNICKFHMRKPYGELAQKINSFKRDDIKIPAIVKAELLVGAMKSKRPDENVDEVLMFCNPFEIIPFDDDATKIYGRIKADLERRGQPIGFNDVIIAATALANNGILITNNTREFIRVEGLRCEDWTKE